MHPPRTARTTSTATTVNFLVAPGICVDSPPLPTPVKPRLSVIPGAGQAARAKGARPALIGSVRIRCVVLLKPMPHHLKGLFVNVPDDLEFQFGNGLPHSRTAEARRQVERHLIRVRVPLQEHDAKG